MARKTKVREHVRCKKVGVKAHTRTICNKKASSGSKRNPIETKKAVKQPKRKVLSVSQKWDYLDKNFTKDQLIDEVMSNKDIYDVDSQSSLQHKNKGEIISFVARRMTISETNNVVNILRQPRQTPQGKAQDKRIKALPKGKRISASGKPYYEYRDNRSDSDRRVKL